MSLGEQILHGPEAGLHPRAESLARATVDAMTATLASEDSPQARVQATTLVVTKLVEAIHEWVAVGPVETRRLAARILMGNIVAAWNEHETEATMAIGAPEDAPRRLPLARPRRPSRR